MDARLSYRETAARGATPVKLVGLLFEQALDDLRLALAALEKGDIEARTRGINHAIVVIGQLQASLNLEQGGTVARNLERFYQLVRKGLMAAQFQQSARGLQEQITLLLMVREAWLEVERVPAMPDLAAADDRTDWSG
jgi:flagellar secretion chaperone FliS